MAQETNTSDTNNSASLPKLSWKTTTCEVCGASFDYISRRKPHVCKQGDCIYKYEYKIEPHTWASYQPTLFDR